MSTVVYVDTATAAPPRLRDAPRTRRSILQAAILVFAERGYAETGVRDVAAAAGVNSALVSRYFGPKERLFEAALREAMNMTDLLNADRQRFGAEVVGLFFRTQDAPSPLSMMILSASNPLAKDVCVQVLQEQVIAPLAGWLGPPHGEARAAELNILWSGFLTAWKLLPLRPLEDSGGMGEVRVWLETVTQAIVDGENKSKGK